MLYRASQHSQVGPSVLSVEHMSCGYGKTVILPDVSFSVAQGEVLSLLGPNGVGKTTLFKTMLGLLRSMGGEIRIDGIDVGSLGPRERAQLMAYVPQVHTPPFPFKALEVVLMGRTPHLGPLGSPTGEDQRIALGTMERLGIDHLKDRIYSRLSGGERQLVLIARAMGQHPRILMMDEPTANLDFGNQSRLLAQVRNLADQGLAVILTTHHPDHALSCSHKVALIRPNRRVSIGPKDEQITETNLADVYGIPVKISEVNANNGKTIKTCVPLTDD